MKRNKFNLGYTKLLSLDMGQLVPVGILEVNPGDSMRQATSALIRLAPMTSPPMHPVDCRIHHWFVPFRLLWDNWENFITGGPDGLNASVFPTVTVPGGGFAVGSLADYFGIPPSIGAGQAISALPFRAYALIFNEWYRDQDLVTRLAMSTADGADTTTSLTLTNCAWEKDYLTSARPWEVKGPAVTIPITGNAPIKGLGIVDTGAGSTNLANVRESSPLPNRTYPFYLDGTKLRFETDTATASTNKPSIYADMSQVAGVTVNSLRQSLAIQRYQEAAARYGSRYTEYLLRLGVKSSDARLQRPEYLGGGRQRLQFSEVVQTAPSPEPDTDPVGSLKGHGITALRTNNYQRFFEEHGFCITLMSIKPKTIYSNGLHKLWNRRTKFDFWQRELEHIGQQQVLNKEAYMAHSTPDGVFGYQDRYDEYRRSESSIAGEFRTLLVDWHFARSFGSNPALNSTFVQCVPTENPFAITSENVVRCQVKHQVVARRLLSAEGHSFIF